MYVSVSVCRYVPVGAVALGGLKGASDHVGVELQVVVSHPDPDTL